MTCFCGQLLPRRSGGPTNPHADATKIIQGWAHVKREYGRSIRKRGRAIIVNNISDFFARRRTPDDPVVAVKRRFVTGLEERRQSRHRGTVRAINTYLKRSGKSHPANSQNLAFGESSPGRPLKRTNCGYFFPSLLIQEVVNLHHGLDLGFRRFPSLPGQRVVKLLWRWVLSFPRAIAWH